MRAGSEWTTIVGRVSVIVPADDEVLSAATASAAVAAAGAVGSRPRRRSPPRKQAARRQEYVAHARERARHAVQAEIEEAHVSFRRSLAVRPAPLVEHPQHHQVSARADERARASEDGGKRQRYHHLPLGDVNVLRPSLDDGDHDGHHRCVVEETGNHRDGEHQSQLRACDRSRVSQQLTHVPVQATRGADAGGEGIARILQRIRSTEDLHCGVHVVTSLLQLQWW